MGENQSDYRKFRHKLAQGFLTFVHYLNNKFHLSQKPIRITLQLTYCNYITLNLYIFVCFCSSYGTRPFQLL